MSSGRPPPGSIPTLTEVVSWPVVAPAAPAASTPALAVPADEPERLPSRPAEPVGQAELVQQVLGDIQKQVELMLDVRLREALAPVLARATDALVRDARKELSVALHDIVVQSVNRELARRGRP